jgi:negative regulator of replication initiation
LTVFKDVEAQVPGFELASFRERMRVYLAVDPSTLPTSGASASGR